MSIFEIIMGYVLTVLLCQLLFLTFLRLENGSPFANWKPVTSFICILFMIPVFNLLCLAACAIVVLEYIIKDWLVTHPSVTEGIVGRSSHFLEFLIKER